MYYLLFVLCTTVVHAGRWDCDPVTESCPEWNKFGGEYLVKTFQTSGICTGESKELLHISPALGCVTQGESSIRGSCDAVNRYVVMYTYKTSDCTGEAQIRYRDQNNFNPLPDSACAPNKCAGMYTMLSITSPAACQCSEEPCADKGSSFLNTCTNPASAPSPVPATAPSPATSPATTPASAKTTSSTSTTASLSFIGVTVAMIAMVVSSFPIFA